jgi:signal transduction histidine kinase
MNRLASLLDTFHSAGTALSVDVVGQTSRLNHQSDLAAYRITQEALTNATKHAPGAPVNVALCWQPTYLSIEVRNARPLRRATPRAAGTGHGLIGMRERARAAGATFDAGPTGHGGYRVIAELRARPHPDTANPTASGGWPASPGTKECTS